MYVILKKLEGLILEYQQEFEKKKRERNIVDFSDVEHFALQILCTQNENGEIEKTQIAKSYEEKFEEIAIDEYQDSNLVQEYILKSIARENNIFMVGDVKQSIYKFRQAMPELFLSKYASYPSKSEQNGEENLKIQLFKNFRSRENVLDITNLVFKNIMSDLLGDIDYNEDEYLNLGADYEKISQDLKTEVDVIDLAQQEDEEDIVGNEDEENQEKSAEPEERIEDVEIEARFVAKRIQQLIQEKFQVWDRKKGSFRDIQYKDIVVLLRATTQSAPIFEQEILKLEMPVFADSSQGYLDSIEIQTVMSLLKIIDNPMQDIPLVTVLRSSIGGFSDNDLVEIRLNDKQDNFYICLKKAKVNADPELKLKIEKFLNQLEVWRKEQEILSLDELIWKIYSDTGYYNYVGLMPNGELRQANLKMLFERAKSYEKASFKGLYHFIHFIERLQLSSGDMGVAKIIGENENVIRIMSIHKSKGLEFPVVILAQTGKQFNLMDLNESILLHQDLGIGVKYKDDELQVQYDTLTKEAIKNKMKVETLSEEMRILYVALTRAKEKLIITGRIKEYEKALTKMQEQVNQYPSENGKIEHILVKKYKKYLDWLMLVYLYEQENINQILNWNVYSKKDVLAENRELPRKENNDIIQEFEENNIDISTGIQQELQEILNWEYPNLLATTIPTKASVTQLKQLNQEYKKVEDLEISFPKPKFLKSQDDKLTNAQKGTLVHLCMQYLRENVSYDLQKVKDLIQDLLRREIITEKEAENINPYSILQFTKSAIWEELQQAKEIQREKAFYIQIPAKEIYQKELTENILVQGIIDLYYINKNGELILVDYKTDYVEKGNEKEIVIKYRKQLDLYKQALEEALNRKVEKSYIYSTYLGKEIEIY